MAESAVITSRQNPLIKELQSKRDDRESSLMFMEGPRLVQEVLSAGKSIEILLWTPSAESEAVFLPAFEKAKQKIKVSESVFETVSDVKSPQGILVVARCPNWTWRDLLGKPPAPLLVLDGIQDPGNVSTILRTAEAAGAGGVVTTQGTARLFSPKALRGAMGATLRLPCLEHVSVKEILSEIQKASYSLAAATMRSKEKSSLPHTALDWKKPWAIILGQEGQGISPDWEPHAKASLHIPMQAPVESLNVAAAAAILLYESVRGRA